MTTQHTAHELAKVRRALRLRAANKHCPISLQRVAHPFFRYVSNSEPHIVYCYNLEPLLKWIYALDKFVDVYTQIPYTALEIIRLEWLRKKHYPHIGDGVSLTQIAFNPSLRQQRADNRVSSAAQRQLEDWITESRQDIFNELSEQGISRNVQSAVNESLVQWVALVLQDEVLSRSGSGTLAVPPQRVTDLISELQQVQEYVTVPVRALLQPSVHTLQRIVNRIASRSTGGTSAASLAGPPQRVPVTPEGTQSDTTVRHPAAAPRNEQKEEKEAQEPEEEEEEEEEVPELQESDEERDVDMNTSDTDEEPTRLEMDVFTAVVSRRVDSQNSETSPESATSNEQTPHPESSTPSTSAASSASSTTSSIVAPHLQITISMTPAHPTNAITVDSTGTWNVSSQRVLDFVRTTAKRQLDGILDEYTKCR